MQKRLVILILLIGTLLMGVWVQAQDIFPTDEPDDPNFQISFPPPVYTLRGEVEIRGSINLASMTSYFVEFRPIVLEEDLPPNRPWFPATLPGTQAINDDVLGTWNTEITPDGLYEIRLTANLTDGTREHFRVSPLRVENEIPPFLDVDDIDSPSVTNTPSVSGRPTLVPTPTAFSGRPQVTAVVDANVRSGDGVEYDRVGFLLAGDSAEVIGISSFGTGWFYVELENGRRGFISPTTVQASGNLQGLTRVDPPPPPTPPATATPLATATPVTTANLHFTAVVTNPSPPVCNQTFTINVTIENNGTTATASSGVISVTDIHTGSGSVVEQTIGGFPGIGCRRNLHGCHTHHSRYLLW